MSISEVQIAISDGADHAALNELYVSWHYHAGIASSDTVFVATHRNRTIGLVRRTEEQGALMLRGMHVDPDFQRQGVGTRLLQAFVADLPARECFCIPFDHLIAFYGQSGFAVVPLRESPPFLAERVRQYSREGHRVLLMRRPASLNETRAATLAR